MLEPPWHLKTISMKSRNKGAYALARPFWSAILALILARFAAIKPLERDPSGKQVQNRPYRHQLNPSSIYIFIGNGSTCPKGTPPDTEEPIH